MLKWLVQNFNSISRILYIDNNQQFAIIVDDVYNVFMLPINQENPIPCYSRIEDVGCSDAFGDKYDIRSRIPIMRLSELINGHKLWGR